MRTYRPFVVAVDTIALVALLPDLNVATHAHSALQLLVASRPSGHQPDLPEVRQDLILPCAFAVPCLAVLAFVDLDYEAFQP